MTDPAAASASSATTSFEVLGPISVRHGDAYTTLGGRRQVAVLARLLIGLGQTVSMEQLVDAVWDGDTPKRPEVTIRSYVSNLRRLIEPDRATLGGRRSSCIESATPGYRLVVDPEALDAHRFAADVVAGREALAAGEHHLAVEVLGRALDRWTGEPYDGVVETDAVDAARARLNELRLVAVEAHTEALLAAGRHDQVMARLEPVLVEQPRRERLVELAMLALYRSGRQSEALEVCARLRRCLVEGLGIDPGPAVQELEHKILTQNDDLLPRPSSAPPGDAADTGDGSGASVAPITASGAPVAVERLEWEAAASPLAAALDGGGGAIVVVTGEPGSGKSTLVADLADRFGSRATVAVVRCRALTIDQALWPWTELLTDGRIEGMDDGEAPLSERIRTVIERLRSMTGPTLVVVEDLHWADPASIQALVHAAEELADAPILLVATWRATETPSSEQVRALRQLARVPGLTRVELGGLDPDAIEAMVGARPGGATLARRLHQLTAGNPFLVTELLSSLPGEDSPGIDVVATPTTNVREAVRDRIDRLHDQASEVLLLGALVDAPFSAELVADAGDLPGPIVDDVLERATFGGVLASAGPEQRLYRFVHPIVATVLADDVSGPRRARHHAAIGHAMWRQRWPARNVARQFVRAGSPSTTILAARFALDATAVDDDAELVAEAAAIAEQALEVIAAVPNAASLEVDCCNLLAQWARVRGDDETRMSMSARAIAAARRLERPDLLASATAAGGGPWFEGPAIGRLDLLGGTTATAMATSTGPGPGSAGLVVTGSPARRALAAIARGTTDGRRAALAGLERTGLAEGSGPLAGPADRLRLLLHLSDHDAEAAWRCSAERVAAVGGSTSLAWLQDAIVDIGLSLHLGHDDLAAGRLGAVRARAERLGVAVPPAVAVLARQAAWLSDAKSSPEGVERWVDAEVTVLTASLPSAPAESEADTDGPAPSAPSPATDTPTSDAAAALRGPSEVEPGPVGGWGTVADRLAPHAEGMLVGEGGAVLHGVGAYYAGCAARHADRLTAAAELLAGSERHARAVGSWSMLLRTRVQQSRLAADLGDAATRDVALEEARAIAASLRLAPGRDSPRAASQSVSNRFPMGAGHAEAATAQTTSGP